MISRIRGTPMMAEITIMKTAGRLLSKMEFITVVVLTAPALVIAVGGEGGDEGPAAGMMLEIFCKAFVALVNADVVFSKALVVFSNLSLTISDIAPTVAFVVSSADPPPPVVLFLMDSVAFGIGGDEGKGVVVVATTLSEDNKLLMKNRDTRTSAVTVFIYILFSFYS
jgi:hypothetical protein